MHKVTVTRNRGYHFKGTFSGGEPGTPIYGEDGVFRGITKPRMVIHVHSYGGEAPFFEALTKGRLLGTKCTNPACEGKGSVYLPFRIHCPDCLARMAIVDLTEKAVKTAFVHTFIVTARTGAWNKLPKPIRFLDVEIPGVCTILKGYMSGPGEPAFDMRLVPIFRTKSPTFTILDLSWVAEGTKAKDLPKGFTFALPARKAKKRR